MKGSVMALERDGRVSSFPGRSGIGRARTVEGMFGSASRARSTSSVGLFGPFRGEAELDRDWVVKEAIGRLSRVSE